MLSTLPANITATTLAPKVENLAPRFSSSSSMKTIDAFGAINSGELIPDPFFLDEDFDDDIEIAITLLIDPSVDLGVDDLDDLGEDSEAHRYFTETILNSCVDEELRSEEVISFGNHVLVEKDLFLDVDEADLREINAGCVNRSLGAERRFKIWFKKWQIAKKFHPDFEPEDLPLPLLAEAMVPFIMGLRKLNGKFYPSQSLSQMFRVTSRLIRRHQIVRIQTTHIDELPIILQKHAMFQRARTALIKAMNRSIKAGANKSRKKSNPLRWKDEDECLKDIDMQITHAHSVQKRFAYFCLSRFMIKATVSSIICWTSTSSLVRTSMDNL